MSTALNNEAQSKLPIPLRWSRSKIFKDAKEGGKNFDGQDVDDLKKLISSLRSSKAACEDKEARLRDANWNLEVRIQELESQMNGRTITAENLVKSKADLESDTRKKAEEIDFLKAERENLESIIAALGAKHSSEFKTLQTLIDELEDKCAVLECRNRDLEYEIRQNALKKDTLSATSPEKSSNANFTIDSDESPPLSPIKGGATDIESEKTRRALARAQQQITQLRRQLRNVKSKPEHGSFGAHELSSTSYCDGEMGFFHNIQEFNNVSISTIDPTKTLDHELVPELSNISQIGSMHDSFVEQLDSLEAELSKEFEPKPNRPTSPLSYSLIKHFEEKLALLEDLIEFSTAPASSNYKSDITTGPVSLIETWIQRIGALSVAIMAKDESHISHLSKEITGLDISRLQDCHSTSASEILSSVAPNFGPILPSESQLDSHSLRSWSPTLDNSSVSTSTTPLPPREGYTIDSVDTDQYKDTCEIFIEHRGVEPYGVDFSVDSDAGERPFWSDPGPIRGESSLVADETPNIVECQQKIVVQANERPHITRFRECDSTEKSSLQIGVSLDDEEFSSDQSCYANNSRVFIEPGVLQRATANANNFDSIKALTVKWKDPTVRKEPQFEPKKIERDHKLMSRNATPKNITVSRLAQPLMNSTKEKAMALVAQTVIGECLYKYQRRSFAFHGVSAARHERFFWIHPYTLTLFWDKDNPAVITGKPQSPKGIPILDIHEVVDNNPLPCGLYSRSLVFKGHKRDIKVTCPNSTRHEVWFRAVKYMLANRQQNFI